MFRTAGPTGLTKAVMGLLLAFTTLSATPAFAQAANGPFLTGPAARAYSIWAAAMQAVLDRDQVVAEERFDALLKLDPSPLRLALLAAHTVERTAGGGAVLLFDQDYEAGALGEAGKEIAARLATGREQMNEADDLWHYAQIGRFDVAEANLQALLAANPDPVAVLELTDREPRRRDILVQLTGNDLLAAPVRELLKVLAAGELAVKADPTRIQENIERLGGPPRGFENAAAALKDSGEYGIPFLIQYLRNPEKKPLLMPILRVLPTLDRPALNPLVIALRMDDHATKRHLIEALGKMGYVQAVPYLLQLVADEATPDEVKSAATAAVDAIRAHGAAVDPQVSAGESFFRLAEDYYNEKPSLAADVRLDTANVWYWRDSMLVNIEVPTPIFNEVMCLRCCEESLRLDKSAKGPLALWLAANFRREAELAPGQTDATRPENFPPPAYFAQSAGPEYCLAALSRAVDRTEAAVALGTIEALRTTAGPASLVTGVEAQSRLPLAEALSFPDRLVRIRASLTLGAARPQKEFSNYQNLMPVLAEALLLHGGARNALVVDPDTETANAVAGLLRATGYEVLIDASLFEGLRKIREQAPGLEHPRTGPGRGSRQPAQRVPLRHHSCDPHHQARRSE
ncbi:MAG: HEAT repeat domain-containing protein [Planctomycetota bacterium]